MDIRKYFKDIKGVGILSTADDQGKVNSAVYGRPHVISEDSIAFIMPDRLTHHNLQSNPRASYLFMEEAPGYKGRRLYLTKIREEEDSELLHSLRRIKCAAEKEEYEEARFLVFFKIDKILPLIGPGD